MDDVVAKLQDAVEKRESLDLAGPAGSGRSHCLTEVSEFARSKGLETLWTSPGTAPFQGLDPLLKDDATLEGLTLDEAQGYINKLVSERLQKNTVIIADDAASLDAHTASVLEACREHGCVLRAYEHAAPDRVDLKPATEENLRELFHGPDRILHLREDAAAELFRRTRGFPARFVDEVKAWVRAGLCRWEGDKIAIDRSALDTLRAGITPLAMNLRIDRPAPTLPTPIEELLVWIQLMYPYTTVEKLATASGARLFHIEGQVQQLIEAEAVCILEDGTIEPLVVARLLQTWDSRSRKVAHQKIAHMIPPGEQGRLFHLLHSGDPIGVAEEALTVGRNHIKGGSFGAAEATLTEGLITVRGVHPELETQLLEELVSVAFYEMSAGALMRVRREVARSSCIKPYRDRINQLINVALKANKGGGEAALEELVSLGSFDNEKLELWRQATRVRASQQCSTITQAKTIQDIEAEFSQKPSDGVESRVLAWKGILRYREGRFAEAADLHLRAISDPLSARLSCLLNAASALLEVNDHTQATELAQQSLKLARQSRATNYECRAEWILRAAAYRSGAATEPDTELVDIALNLGEAFHAAAILLTEAALCWRLGRVEDGRNFAKKASDLWGAPNRTNFAYALSWALACACGLEVDETERRKLWNHAASCASVPLRLQIRALLATTLEVSSESDRELAEARCPENHWGWRREVLSIEESLEMLEQ